MVYFIQGEQTRLIKIGKTVEVRRRLCTLQSGSPDKLKILAVIEDKHSDAPYHAQFRTAWVFGEWFKPTAELTAFIKTLPKFRISKSYRRRTNFNVNPAMPRQYASSPKSAPYEPTQIRQEFSLSQVLEEVVYRLSSLIYQRPAEYVAHPEEFTQVRTALVQQVVDEYRGAHAAN